AVLHLAGDGVGGERLGRVVGRVQADEEVVDEQRRRPYPEPHERLGVDGAQQEDVDGDGRRRQPRHHGHPPQLRRPRLRHQRPQARRRRQPRRHRHRVRHPPSPVQPPARRRRHRRRQDGGDARGQPVAVGARRLPGHVVAADEERDGDEHEDEERGDGEEVGEDVEVGEEGDDGGGEEHGHRGVHRRPRPRVHPRQPRRHHVRAGDVGEVARLADGADEQHGGHPLERAERDDVLGPAHATVGERD
ncbi:Os03g0641250, partial [Oryza sativa Japonica Group]